MSTTSRSLQLTLPTSSHDAELLDVAGAAAHLGTPVGFIRRLIAERRIPFYKLGRYVRIDKADLDHFIADGRVDVVRRH